MLSFLYFGCFFFYLITFTEIFQELQEHELNNVQKGKPLMRFSEVLHCKSRPVSLDDPSIKARLLMRPDVWYYVDPLNLNL